MVQTVANSFTAAAVGPILTVGNAPALVQWSVSGTYSGHVLTVERSKAGRSGRWAVISGPHTTDDATLAGSEQAQPQWLYRINVANVDTGSDDVTGTIVTSLNDEDRIIQEFRNADGVVVLRLKDSGLEIPGALDVIGEITSEDGVSLSAGAEQTFGAGTAAIASSGTPKKIASTTAAKGDTTGFTIKTNNGLLTSYTGTRLLRIRGRFLVDVASGTDNITLHVFDETSSIFETPAQSVAASTPKLFEFDFLANITGPGVFGLAVYAENKDTTEDVTTAAAAERTDTTPAHGFFQVTSA